MNWIDTFKHVLPNGRAWWLTPSKTLRMFFDGLTATPESTREAIDSSYLDLDPQQTRELNKWEDQFALAGASLTEQQRRDRLDARWKALGGQSPRYIQDTLRGAGFDVYVHDWFGSRPSIGDHSCVTPRNPFLYLSPAYGGLILNVECGAPLAECGEPSAECGESTTPTGYPLAGKSTVAVPDYIISCGVDIAECGEEDASCGNFLSYAFDVVEYTIPTDANKWPYFFYIGGETFGTTAQVSPSRRNEFEDLILKIKPAHLWAGIIVSYT
jgi:hypothetical protein